MLVVPGKNDGRKRHTSDIPTENLDLLVFENLLKNNAT